MSAWRGYHWRDLRRRAWGFLRRAWASCGTTSVVSRRPHSRINQTEHTVWLAFWESMKAGSEMEREVKEDWLPQGGDEGPAVTGTQGR